MVNFHKKPATYVSHVALRVNDLDKSIKFYCNIIGFKILEKTDSSVELTANGITPLLTLISSKGINKRNMGGTGLYHFALLLPHRKDLASFLVHIAKNNYPIGAADHEVSEAIYIQDPEGNGIEIYSDRNPSKWRIEDSYIQMSTDPLDVEDLMNESPEAWDGLPTDTFMGHIHLHVSNLKEAGEFYNKALGFDVVLPYHNALFLSSSGYHHHIAINTWKGTASPELYDNSCGLAYYNIIYGSKEELNRQLTAIKALGYEVEEKNDSYSTKDPSGNMIILSAA